jgi:non-ribosomal peptide synthetase component F
MALCSRGPPPHPRREVPRPCAFPLSVLEFRDRAAAFYGDVEAVVDGDRRFTYGQYAERTHRLANALRGLGVKPGDRVSYLSYNCHQPLERANRRSVVGSGDIRHSSRQWLRTADGDHLEPDHYRLMVLSADREEGRSRGFHQRGVRIRSPRPSRRAKWRDRPPARTGRAPREEQAHG